jgi:hypothetical protein
MNTSGLNGKLLRLDAEHHDKLFDLMAVVTEKIHGENFRVGIDGKGEFIGQKNMLFREFEGHPNWNRMSEEVKGEIFNIHSYIHKMKKHPKYKTKNITFFGELYGTGMQTGFTYPSFDDGEEDSGTGLRVLWIDIKTNESYMNDADKRLIFSTVELETVPVIGIMTIKEALELDIENIESRVANEKHIEGVVITPLEIPDWWRFPSRLILKYKTKKYTEESKDKHKKEKPINNFVSKYVDFVTEARLDHVIQSLMESGVEILYEMRDLQHIPRAMIGDIEKEENDGQPLAKEDKKYLGSYIPKFYKKYLDQMLEDLIKERNRAKNK